MISQSQSQSAEARAYHHEYYEALQSRHNKSCSFSNLIGRHAAHMIGLAVRARDGSKQDLMKGWVDIHKVNQEWVNRICPVQSNATRQFDELTASLVHGFSDVIRDYIIDKTFDPDYVNNVINCEAKFYKEISPRVHSSKRLKTIWKQYTHSLFRMANVIDEHGTNCDRFYSSGRDCLVAANLLGVELDSALSVKQQGTHLFTCSKW